VTRVWVLWLRLLWLFSYDGGDVGVVGVGCFDVVCCRVVGVDMYTHADIVIMCRRCVVIGAHGYAVNCMLGIVVHVVGV